MIEAHPFSVGFFKKKNRALKFTILFCVQKKQILSSVWKLENILFRDSWRRLFFLQRDMNEPRYQMLCFVSVLLTSTVRILLKWNGS